MERVSQGTAGNNAHVEKAVMHGPDKSVNCWSEDCTLTLSDLGMLLDPLLLPACCFNGPNKWKPEQHLSRRHFDKGVDIALEVHHWLLGINLLQRYG
jgi:hypothetical protein